MKQPKLHSDIAILMYHEVTEPHAIDALSRKIQRAYICTTTEFEQQIRLLSDEGYAIISLSDVVAAHGSQTTTLPERAVVITFDDGYEGNHAHAVPVLRRYGATATFFVVSNKIGDPNMMSAGQLRELAATGFEVQSHTANHPLLSRLGAESTWSELAESKHRLEEVTKKACEYLSLPNGDSNPFLRRVAEQIGYRAICGSSFGYNANSPDLYLLQRIAVKGGLPLDQFRRIVGREPALMRQMRWRSAAKMAVASMLGKHRYDRLYNAFFGVEEQDKRRQGT